MSARAYSTSAWSLRVRKKNTNRRIVARDHHVPLVPAHIRVQLTHVLVVKFGDFQLHEHVAFEDPMVEHQIYKPVSVADEDALLACLETKTVAQFQQELLQPIEYSILEIRLAHHLPRPQTKKFEDVGITNCKAGLESLSANLDPRGQLLLVFREARTLEVETTDLSLEFAHRPVAPDALDLVKRALERIVNCDELVQVSKRQRAN